MAIPGRGVLVAIPAFNEQLTVAGVVLGAREHADSVIVVDDGSVDRTASQARAAGATVLQHAGNRGKGAAMATALRFAKANGYTTIVFIDADGQHDTGSIPELIAPLGRDINPADLVIGDRRDRTSEMPAYRKVGKAVLDIATSAASGGNLVDSQSGFRALGPRAIDVFEERIRSQGFEIESEMVVIARRHKLTIESVPIRIEYGNLDGSTLSPLPHGFRVLERVIFFLTLRRPLLTLGVPGFLFVVFGAYWGIRMLNVYKTDQTFVTSYGLAAATFTLLGGILMATALMMNVVALVWANDRSRMS